MTPRTWRAIGSALITSVDPRDSAALNPNGAGAIPPWELRSGGSPTNFPTIAGIFAYSGAIYVPEDDEFCRFGGGHADSGGNPIAALRLWKDSPDWFLRAPPSGAIGSGVTTVDDGQENTNRYSDKWPRSTHSYDLLQNRGGQILLVQPGAPFVSGSGSSLGLFGHTKKKGWESLAQGAAAIGSAGGNASLTSCYDPTRDKLYVYANASGAIQHWDMATRAKGYAPGNSGDGRLYTNFTTDARTIYVPEFDVQVQLNAGYSGHIGIYDYGRTANVDGFGFDRMHEPGASGTPPSYSYSTTGGFSPNGVWVPGYGPGGWGSAIGCILCWHGGTSWKMATPNASDDPLDQWAWSTLTADASNALDPGNPNSQGMFGGVFYAPKHGGVCVHPSATSTCKLFALRA